jgi:hypothetical protein
MVVLFGKTISIAIWATVGFDLYLSESIAGVPWDVLRQDLCLILPQDVFACH